MFRFCDFFFHFFRRSPLHRTILGWTPLPLDRQKCCAFFFPLPQQFSLFFSLSLWEFSLNFGGVVEGRNPRTCTFGLSCEIPAALGAKPQRLANALVLISAVTRSTLPPKSCSTRPNPNLRAPPFGRRPEAAPLFLGLGPSFYHIIHLFFFCAFFNCFCFLSFLMFF